MVVFVRHATGGELGRIAALIAGRPETFDTSVPVVVEKIQKLSRLETVVYSLDTVVEGERSSPILPDSLAGDKILLVVTGEMGRSPRGRNSKFSGLEDRARGRRRCWRSQAC